MSNPSSSANRAALFVSALSAYLTMLQNRVDTLNVGENARTYPDRVVVKSNNRYVGVYTHNRDSMTGKLTGDPVIHSFVDKVGGKHGKATNNPGAILYPTSDTAPAINERGNIFDEDHGLSALAPDSVSVRELPRGRGPGGSGPATFLDGTDLEALTAAITFADDEAVTA